MSKRFYFDEFSEDIFDEEIQTYPSNQSICGILNKQADRIAELEEQLKNATKQVRNEVFETILDISNGYWRYFTKNGQAYMLDEDLINLFKEIEQGGNNG